LELILMLSLPRDPGVTTFLESGNMKNLCSVANRINQRVIDQAQSTSELGRTNHRKGSSLSLPPKSGS